VSGSIAGSYLGFLIGSPLSSFLTLPFSSRKYCSISSFCFGFLAGSQAYHLNFICDDFESTTIVFV
jgi:hypothetical protein